MTDAIITWVDGRDPAFRSRRNHYLQLEKGEGVPHEANAALDTRINESGELRYNIQLIRKNAPWIERIHLVTDDQRPPWLTEAKADELGVEVVDLTVIFHGYEAFLPSFNSMSISSMMHRIPGLAPEFMHLDDDFFILRPVEKDAYFRNGRPVFRGCREVRSFPWPFLKKPPWRLEGEPDHGLIKLRFGGEKILRGKTERVTLYHAPRPVNTQDYAKILEHKIAHNARFRFRSSEQFEPVTLYANLLMHRNACEIVGSDIAYVDPLLYPKLTPQNVRELADRDHILHACFQSLDEYDDASRQAVFDFLEDRLAA